MPARLQRQRHQRRSANARSHGRSSRTKRGAHTHTHHASYEHMHTNFITQPSRDPHHLFRTHNRLRGGTRCYRSHAGRAYSAPASPFRSFRLPVERRKLKREPGAPPSRGALPCCCCCCCRGWEALPAASSSVQTGPVGICWESERVVCQSCHSGSKTVWHFAPLHPP